MAKKDDDPKALQKLKAGFAKIHGEDFEYYLQSYSITLGRNSKKASVDLDLAGISKAGDGEVGSMNISRTHARIFYDFVSKCFMMEVLGKNGVIINEKLRPQGTPPVPLSSQDLVQIGDRKFYFLLPAVFRPQEPLQINGAKEMNGGKRKRSKGSDTPGPSVKQKAGSVGDD